MKRTPLNALVYATLVLPVVAFAAENHSPSTPMTHMQSTAVARTQSIEGTVKKVDATKGRISVAHSAMHGMPAMTMIYTLKDPAWSQNIKVGDHISFECEPVNGKSTIVVFKTR